MLTFLVLSSLIVLGAAKYHIPNPVSINGNVNDVLTAGDSGSLTNCGDAQHNFTFSWSPRALHIGQYVTLAFDFTAHTLIQQAMADITIWAKGIQEPIIITSYTMSCDKVKTFIKCPMQPGKRIKMQVPHIHIPDTYPIPSGTYVVKIEAKSQDGQPIICGKGDVPVVAAPQPDWDEWDEY